ncbi:GH92 family glycosyl hydrolase [Jiulongibacter sediminis]|uniref:Alpha-mannosidase n=1 Tax=Jiulongibacter sediminis TaxID=1605367 RepID=A0A0P7C185_9BACT|nr:GH92 family glycosyl hydrolase [Jiulongibacter sediminis]KPM47083.1 alpha-mannosidase [Jiulongibacter sediminis]TBX22426.1 alpha-mannosidase [Jiulongibacter sediminis]
MKICISLLCLIGSFLGYGQRPVDLVYPHLDAANSRWFFFNSASRPFGMVNLSPDNEVNGAWNAGYRYKKDSIKCFSHIHAWQLSGIPVLPVSGEFKGHLGADVYGSSFSHDVEIVKPGYHKVVLDSYGITAELTSTTRVGFHQYSFPEAAESHILFDFSTFLGPTDTERGYVKKVNDTEIEGYAIMGPTIRRPKSFKVYFVARFDQPFEQIRAWEKGKLKEFENNLIEGEDIGAYVSFATQQNEKRKMKVAISYVNTNQARLNMDTELPHWDFEECVRESQEQWNEMLSRIKIEGGTEKEQRRFYTDLWHALQGRRIVSDVNGKYIDYTGERPKVGQIPLNENGEPKFNHHNSDSFWGAQWTLNTLWHLVYPEVTESFVNSMLLMYEDGGLIPRGPSGGNYTYVMTGAATTPFVSSAYLKGLKGFDAEKVYEGLHKNHFEAGMMSKAGYEHNTIKGGGVEYYINQGFVPHPLSERRYGFHQDGTTQTLEYAYQDFALAQMAQKLGKTDDYHLFMSRAKNYRNLWNENLKVFWNRDKDGNWEAKPDLLRYDHGFEEGNAAQYRWWVPHDIKGLIDLYGGRKAFIDTLNTAFERAEKHDFVSGKAHDQELQEELRRVYINYGNQPSIETAFLFSYAGAPWLTQYWSRKVVNKVYSDLTPELGYSGDEDQGLMGSLAVLMKIGLFSVNGGTTDQPFYEIGSPVFDKVTISLNPDYYPGESFVIEAAGNNHDNVFVQAATLNNTKLRKAWLPHEELVKGGTLKLQMSNKPNKKWGKAEVLAPPSMSN